jgi:hypothetical protein
MRKLLLLLLLSSFSNFSTITDAFGQVPTIHLPVPKAHRIADSLRTLPKVRLEAERWRGSAYFFKSAADSALWAHNLSKQALTSQQKAYMMQAELLKNEEIKVDWWKKVARRRGFLNYLLAGVSAGLGYLLVK